MAQRIARLRFMTPHANAPGCLSQACSCRSRRMHPYHFVHEKCSIDVAQLGARQAHDKSISPWRRCTRKTRQRRCPYHSAHRCPFPLSLPARSRWSRPRQGHTRTDPYPGHSARVDGRPHRRLGARASASRRNRCAGKKAVSLSPGLSRSARAREIRTLTALREAAAEDTRACAAGSSPPGGSARQGAGISRATARNDFDTCREWRVCAEERLVRAYDHA